MTTKDIETQQDDNNEEQTNTAPDADVEDNADETEDDVVDAMQKPLNTLLVSIVQSNLLKTYNETYQQNIPKREELPEEVKTALEPKVVEVTERIDALKEMPK
ncbi:hypothetical protein KA478_03975 [Patescibacteria group bacterium]|nr:hypothetical protein [Patescibacteria group bacterium]